MNQGVINFFSENNFQLQGTEIYREWVERMISSEGRSYNEITYIFCDDSYLLDLNQRFLQHDTLTDIITFDHSVEGVIGGDIFISTERVLENCKEYKVPFETELRRVMSHGVLHLCGYKDKLPSEMELMRKKEDEKMKMFHVEQ